MKPRKPIEPVDRTPSGSGDAEVRCGVCGGTQVHLDEVPESAFRSHLGSDTSTAQPQRDLAPELRWVLLAECSRCDHRWTRSGEPAPHPVRAHVAARSRAAVATAA